MSESRPSNEFITLDPIAIRLAQTLPKIPSNDPRVGLFEAGYWNGPTKFGNNFYHAFQSPAADTKAYMKIYREPLQNWSGWESFSTINASLLGDIATALEGVAAFEPIQAEDTRILMAGSVARRNGEHELSDQIFSLLNELDAATGHPLGIRAIEAYAWDQLNPVLELASDKLSSSGFNPKELYG